jgi:DsbC/DsbD-like thiol-disulfide interchange protein
MKSLLLLVLASASVLAQTPSPKPGAAVDIKNSASVRGKYVALLVGTNKEHVSPGGTVTLMLRATPGQKMHVYAPGEQGYTPVTLALQKDAAYGARPVVYPASTLFEFAPLNEKVRVYDAAFTLKQDVTVAASADLKRRAAAGDTLAIKGTFTYQACDDTICYRSETLAVEWKLKLVPAGRQLHVKGLSK